MTPTPFWRRYARFFGPDPAADVEDELSFHLEAKTDDLIRQGLSTVSQCPQMAWRSSETSSRFLVFSRHWDASSLRKKRADRLSLIPPARRVSCWPMPIGVGNSTPTRQSLETQSS